MAGSLWGPSSLPHSISYPETDTSSLVNHNAYMASSSAPHIAYAPMDQQSSEYSPPEAGLVVPVFQKGDDPIDAINHMMSFLTSVVASRYPATNNQFRTSSNPRQGGAQGKQRVITCYNCKGEGHMSKQCTKPRRKHDAEWFKDKVLLVQAQANGQVLQEEELEILADPGSGEAPGKQRVSVCYNCKGEGHMSKQCTKPKRKRDAEWFKDKVNTKFLNALPSEWSKFVTDVKLVWDLHTTNVDQLHAYLEHSQPEAGLVIPVFQKGDDPIDAINHMMSFLTSVVASRYPTTNNQLRTSSNPRQQATINNGRVTIQPIQGR
nr:hypothetical protein [Tanacetum cinerariifolium]